MKNYSGFKNYKNWYKGNLHSHTTVSDGMLTPEEAVKYYKENGYHFICLSEHETYTDYRNTLDSEDFITIPSVERSIILYEKENTSNRYKVHHMHGILGTKKMQENAERLYKHMEHITPKKFYGTWEGKKLAQELSDELNKNGCVVTYNHPIWSRVNEEEFIYTEGVTALEIFNFNTVQESNTGYDVTYWDRMLRMGKKINAFASDDNHNEGLFEDSFGGWICVQSPDLTHENIVQNFIDGNYYSSSGPTIYDWGVRDGVAFIRTSNVEHINFVCGNIINDGTTVIGKKYEDNLNFAEFKLKGHETYLRIEAVDKYGRTAWTNPIYFE